MGRIAADLHEAVGECLRSAGDPGSWEVARGLGGSQSAVVRVRTARAEYVLKHGMPGPMALAEARGLALLADTGAIRVPAVFGSSGDPPFVLIEYLPRGGSYSDARLGEQLAALHRHTAQTYGLDHDNFIGRTAQQNGRHASWVAFYREERLAPQAALAARAGRLPPDRARRLDRLMARLGDYLDDAQCVPSLIHGDLWSGNAIAGPGGVPAIIDPAVSYSDREAELAMMRLFGGFSPACYEAYDAAWPLEPGWRERTDLYQLYHLLNHLNLFGESYGSGVDAVLRRYA